MQWRTRSRWCDLCDKIIERWTILAGQFLQNRTWNLKTYRPSHNARSRDTRHGLWLSSIILGVPLNRERCWVVIYLSHDRSYVCTPSKYSMGLGKRGGAFMERPRPLVAVDFGHVVWIKLVIWGSSHISLCLVHALLNGDRWDFTSTAREPRPLHAFECSDIVHTVWWTTRISIHILTS